MISRSSAHNLSDGDLSGCGALLRDDGTDGAWTQDRGPPRSEVFNPVNNEITS